MELPVHDTGSRALRQHLLEHKLRLISSDDKFGVGDGGKRHAGFAQEDLGDWDRLHDTPIIGWTFGIGAAREEI